MTTEKPDYSRFTTVEEVEAEMLKRKETLYHRVKKHSNISQQKKDEMHGFNEVLKETKEEIEHELGVLSALEDRRKVLSPGMAPPVLVKPMKSS